VAHFFCWYSEPRRGKKTQLGHSETVSATVNSVVIFARFSDENAAVPSWGKDLFDADRLGSISHFYDDMSRGRIFTALCRRWGSRELFGLVLNVVKPLLPSIHPKYIFHTS